jgi:plastocyanin
MNAYARLAGAAAIALTLFACGDDGGSDPAPDGPTVRATTSSTFSPGTLDIDVGETVTWIFGALQHDVQFSAVAGAPANIPLTINANVQRTFATAGVFPYLCTVHPGMTGTVRVGQ